MKHAYRILAMAGLALSVAASAAGNTCDNWVDVQLPYNQFGHLWNTHNGKSPDDPDDPGTWKGWCAPTAIANSFEFLETRYPHIYDQKLTAGDLVGTRNLLQGGWLSPGNELRNGTGCGYDKDIWETKNYWIEDFAPNTTIFGGMVFKPGTDLSDWHGGSALQNAYPSFDFLWGELDHKEDIEIGFWWEMEVEGKMKTVGHMVTLTSLKFCDANSNGQWDAYLDEEAQIDFIDPNDPTDLTWCPLTMDYQGSGALQFLYEHGGNPYLVTLDLAYTESPVPEPLTMAGLLLGVGCLVRYVRDRRRQTEK